MYRKRRFLIFLAYLVTLALLIVSGLSCFSGVAARELSATEGLAKTESEFKSYVTPGCPQVVKTLRGIIGEPPYELSQTGFDNIRNWVANNIRYKSDEECCGKDYWQTPRETLSYLTGDCEDFSILLCSLLRAYGVDAERVYVAVGIDEGKNEHAFLIEDWNCDGEWRRIEPQAPVEPSLLYPLLGFFVSHPDSRLDKYKITAACNDLYYYNDESFSYSEEETNAWTLSKIIITVSDVVRQVAQFTWYLLELLFN